MVRTLDPRTDRELEPVLLPERRGGHGFRNTLMALGFAAVGGIVTYAVLHGGESSSTGDTEATPTTQPNTSTTPTSLDDTPITSTVPEVVDGPIGEMLTEQQLLDWIFYENETYDFNNLPKPPELSVDASPQVTVSWFLF